AASLIDRLHPLETKALTALSRHQSQSPHVALREEELGQTAALEPAQLSMAVEWLLAKSLIRVESERVTQIVSLTKIGEHYFEKYSPVERILSAVRDASQAGRPLTIAQAITQQGTGEEVSQLTPDLLKDGAWRTKRFRKYTISLRPPRLAAGKRHPYREFLDLVKRKLVSMGFLEMRGPLVETEFWNMDALYMPQFHPARAIHDVYFVKEPTHAREIAEPFLSQ